MKRVMIFLIVLSLSIQGGILEAAVIAQSRDEVIQKSDLIFVGRVLEKKSHWNEMKNLIVTDYVFETDEILFTGSRLPNEKQITLTFAGGKLENGLQDGVSEVPVYKVGDKVLLMILDTKTPYISPVTGLFQGSFVAGEKQQTRDGNEITPLLTGDRQEEQIKNDKGESMDFDVFVEEIKTQIPEAKRQPLSVEKELQVGQPESVDGKFYESTVSNENAELPSENSNVDKTENGRGGDDYGLPSFPSMGA